MTAAGRTPTARHCAARDTMTAHRAGWTTSTRSKSGWSGTPRSTPSRSQSTNGSRARAHRANCSANAPFSSSSSTAMPDHWAPWPGKTQTGSPAGRPAPHSPWSVARRRSTSVSRSVPVVGRAARCSNTVRDPASIRATAPTGTSGCRSTKSATRSSEARTAPSLRPDTSRGSSVSSLSASSRGICSTGGASSRIRWALVPLMPKEEMPARRGVAVPGQGWARVTSCT